MKRFLAFLPLICICISLVSCSGKYEPVPSTEREAETVINLTADGKTYEVKYELWRALYLTYKDELSGEGEEYEAKINELILDRVTDIYSVLALCDKVGINLYSRSVEREIEQYITESIEGGGDAIGYGSYEEYLKALKKMNLNYSTAVLLMRYEIGRRELDDYYIGSFSADDIQNGIDFGELTYTREDIKSFYYSDECVRVLRAHLQANAYYDPKVRAEEVREKMTAAASDGHDAVALVIINTSLTAYGEVERGYVISEHNLDKLYYSKLTEAAFALDEGEVSEPIYIHNGEDDIIFILYKTEKNDAHFDESYSEIAYVYLTNEVGKRISEVVDELSASAEYTDFFNTIDYEQVSMND